MALIYTEFEVDNVSFHIFTLPDRRPTAVSSQSVKWLYQMDVESFLYNHDDESRRTGAFYRLLQRTPDAAGRALCLRKASVGQGLITDAEWAVLCEPFRSCLRVLTLVPVDIAVKAIAVFGETDRSAALIKALGFDRPSEWEQDEDEAGEGEGEGGEGRAEEGDDDDDEGGSNSGEHSGDRSDGGASVAATEQFEYNEETHSLWFVHRGWQMLLAQCLFPHSPLRFELSKKNVSSCLDQDSDCRTGESGVSPCIIQTSIRHHRAPRSMLESIYLACSLITSCIQLGGWAVAYALRTEKFYDILGGLNFLAVAAFSAATAEGWEADPRKVP